MEMLNEMAVFSQVVDSGSFSAAARHLGITTSAVSRHVSRLEAHLGGRLLLRTTRALSLTELGRQVHLNCLRMLNSAREIHALAGTYSAKPNGMIRLSAPIVFGQTWLAPKLPGFLERYPEIDIRLTLTDQVIELTEDGVDLAIRITKEPSPGLASRPLCAVRYVLLAAPAYLDKHGEPRTPQELQPHLCCHLGYGKYNGKLTLKKEQQQETIELAQRTVINNSAAIVAFVVAGGGIGLVTDFAANDALKSGQARRVLSDWSISEPYSDMAHIVYTPGRYLALKVRALIDHLIEK